MGNIDYEDNLKSILRTTAVRAFTTQERISLMGGIINFAEHFIHLSAISTF